ncbi:hypothetical protein JCM16303_000092 [Sporobolomyces ruberrimus]
MARSTRPGANVASSNFQSPSPFTPPFLLGLAPATLIVLLLWPVLLLGSFIPIVGLVSLTSLLSCTAFLYLAIPTTFHLLFSQDHLPKKRSFLPFTFPHLPLFTPSFLGPIHLTHSLLRLLWDAHRCSLLSLFFDSISKRILILGGSDSSKILKENIVYLSSSDPLKTRSKRLDVYYASRTSSPYPSHDSSEDPPELAPVVLLIASPSYRSLSSKAFPSSQIALRLRRLGYVVVVPSLSSFPEGTMQEMVWETRESLRWIKDEIGAFGGDRKRVWVLGQGVGASIGALAVVQSAVVVGRDEEIRRRQEREEARKRKEQRVGVDSTDGRDPEAEEGAFADEQRNEPFDPFLESGGRDDGHSRNPSNSGIYEGHYFRSTTHPRPTSTTTVPYSDDYGDDEEEDRGDVVSISSTATLLFPSGVNACRIFSGPQAKTTEERRLSQPEDEGETISTWEGMKVRGMILVGGSYDTMKQVKWEKELGLSEVSSLQKVCGVSRTDAELASPCHLLYAASSLLSSSPSSSSLLPSKYLIIHGGADKVVPYSQSVLLKNLLVGVGIESARVRLRLYREETGIGSLTSLMHQTRYSPLLLDEIERIISGNSLDDLEEEEEDTRNPKQSKDRGARSCRKWGRAR